MKRLGSSTLEYILLFSVIVAVIMVAAKIGARPSANMVVSKIQQSALQILRDR